MNKLTLDKHEKTLVDQYFIKNNINDFTITHFNLAINNTLPTWRTEMLVNTNNTQKNTLAYIDYRKDLLRMLNKA